MHLSIITQCRVLNIFLICPNVVFVIELRFKNTKKDAVNVMLHTHSCFVLLSFLYFIYMYNQW